MSEANTALPTDGESMIVSPFGGGSLFAEAASWSPAPTEALVTPFGESLASLDEDQLEAAATEALIAELEDEEFDAAVEALSDEAAARHLRSLDAWANESSAQELATPEIEEWLEQIAGQVDHRLTELEVRFADRSIELLTEAEIESIEPEVQLTESSPLDAQEYFYKKFFGKVKRAFVGLRKLGQRGLGAIGKLFPIKKLFGVLEKLVPELLRRVLLRAIGKLPSPLQATARKLAKRFGAEAEAGFGVENEENEADHVAEEFDELLAEALLAPNEAVAEGLVEEYEVAGEDDTPHTVDPVRDLDGARRRLVQQLLEAETGRPPTEQMEQFIPVVMAALPLLRLGTRILGRKQIVDRTAGLIATLIQSKVGRGPAQALSRHIASTGLGLLGLEAEAGTEELGAEALVAATEDVVRQLVAEVPEAFDNELLLEAAVQEAFAHAAVRHFPAEVLRKDVVEAESDGEHGVWVMMPRRGPVYRYKKYSRSVPLTITRPVAARVVLSEGDTLEEQLLDAGVTQFPIHGEVDLYEMLPAGELGHLAASEMGEADGSFAEGALEFEELTAGRLPVPVPSPRSSTGAYRPGLRRGRPRPGTRFFRVRVRGVKVRRRRRFGIRLDLTGAKPQLQLHLFVGERAAHTLAAHLQRRRHVQVVAAFGRMLGLPVRTAMAQRLERMLARRKIAVPPGAAARLADRLSQAALKAIAERLPAVASELQRAAKDPVPGVTLTCTFVFASKEAILSGQPETRTLAIRPGMHSA